MVCVDEVLEWFNVLDGHKRIDFICGLLPMCHPLELRYVGSYLEDLAKKDFFALREAELKWNSIQHVGGLVDLGQPHTRSNLITALALLHSYNTECANQIFQVLYDNTQNVPILQAVAAMESAAIQMLLLLTMAVNHPAFTLQQRQTVHDMLDTINEIIGTEEHCSEDQTNELLCRPGSNHSNHGNHSYHSMATPTPGRAHSASVSPSTSPCVRVVLTDIDVTSSRRRDSDKKLEFNLRVRWSNGITIDMCKTHAELLDFHNKLIHLFPDEAGAHRQDRQIPYLHSKRTDEIAQTTSNVTEYLSQMLFLPLKILDSNHLRQFFCDPTFLASNVHSSQSQTSPVAALYEFDNCSPDGSVDRQEEERSPTIPRVTNHRDAPAMDDEIDEQLEVDSRDSPLNHFVDTSLEGSLDIFNLETEDCELAIVVPPLDLPRSPVNPSDVAVAVTASVISSCTSSNRYAYTGVMLPSPQSPLPSPLISPRVHPASPPVHPSPHIITSSATNRPHTNTRYHNDNRYRNDSPLLHDYNDLSSPRHHGSATGESPRYSSHQHYLDSSPRHHASGAPADSARYYNHHHHHNPHHHHHYQHQHQHQTPPDTIGAWLKQQRLHKYSDQLSKYTVQELMSLSEEQLEAEGLTRGARRKFISLIDKCREHARLLNGDVAFGWRNLGPLYPLTILPAHGSHDRYKSAGSQSSSSLDSSDCSSPSASPLPARHDSLGSDLDLDKVFVSDGEGSSIGFQSHSQPQHSAAAAHVTEIVRESAKLISAANQMHGAGHDCVSAAAVRDGTVPISAYTRAQFKPLPVHGQYIEHRQTSSPGASQYTYQGIMPMLDGKYVISDRSSSNGNHCAAPGQFLPHPAMMDKKYPPFNPNQPPPASSVAYSVPPANASTPGVYHVPPTSTAQGVYHHVAPSNGLGPPPPPSSSGCSQCGCNGDCTVAHPPPPLPYPIHFFHAQQHVFPTHFLHPSALSPAIFQHMPMAAHGQENISMPPEFYRTQNFFLAASGHGGGQHVLPMAMPPFMTAGGQGPATAPSPAPSNSSQNGGGGGASTACTEGGKKSGGMSCYNCGQPGHKALECREASMETMTHSGQFHLRYGPRADAEDVR